MLGMPRPCVDNGSSPLTCDPRNASTCSNSILPSRKPLSCHVRRTVRFMSEMVGRIDSPGCLILKLFRVATIS